MVWWARARMTAASTEAMVSMMALVRVLVYSSALTCGHTLYLSIS